MKKQALLLIISSLFISASAMAQTQNSPYTVAQLLAQRDALAASGDTVWVRADLKGLGEDGTMTDNATTEDGEGKTVRHLAALFADDGASFTAYSNQILGELALSDLTNTKNLLIALTYQTGSHLEGNKDYHTGDYEPADLHFSLVEVHGALSIEIKGGYRGYHVPACYVIPKDLVAVKVSAGYSKKNGAYVNCENVFDGAEDTYVTPKNTAIVLLGTDGTHPLVLTTSYFDQKFSNGNALNPGTKAGLYTREGNFTSYYYRFVCDDGRVGFERNSDNMNEVTLAAKDEVYLSVSGKADNFFGNWTWETEDKKWISWTGKKITDYHDVTPAGKQGDVNGDGTVDVADISNIITIMADGTNDTKADVNGDGTVDVADISNVITIMAQ